MREPEHERGFTGFWIPVDIINAEHLTWQQRLIWAEIHSLQKGRLGKCIASNDHFQAVFSIGEGTVKNAMTELKRHGWVTWSHDGNTRELRAVYPEETIPISGIPKSGIPKSGQQNPEIGNRLYKENSGKNSNNPLPPKKEENFLEIQEVIPELKELTIERQAETIYQAYPRKVAKPEGIKAITKALKKIAHPELLAAVEKYGLATKGTEARFIPHPATWFNSERWNDHHEPTKTHDGDPTTKPDWFW